MSEYYASVEKTERIRCRAEGAGNYLLYNPRTDQLHMLDERGKRVYDLCDGRAIDDVIADALIAETPGDPALTPEALLAFLCDLKRRDLVAMR